MVFPFKENKYTRWYINIVTRAKSRIIESYTEKHHIIPRGMGGNNSKENLAQLTPREHFICHLLLTKMVTDEISLRKMKNAIGMMLSSSKTHDGERYIPPSKVFDIARRLHIEALRGRIVSDETKAKQSASAKGKTFSEESRKKMSDAKKGKPLSDETKRKMSEARKGKPSWNAGIASSEETKQKISKACSGEGNGMYGKKHSEEAKLKMSKSKTSE